MAQDGREHVERDWFLFDYFYRISRDSQSVLWSGDIFPFAWITDCSASATLSMHVIYCSLPRYAFLPASFSRDVSLLKSINPVAQENSFGYKLHM